MRPILTYQRKRESRKILRFRFSTFVTFKLHCAFIFYPNYPMWGLKLTVWIIPKYIWKQNFSILCHFGKILKIPKILKSVQIFLDPFHTVGVIYDFKSPTVLLVISGTHFDHLSKITTTVWKEGIPFGYNNQF